MSDYSLQVINHRALASRIPAELVELEGNYNFKPYIGQLPSGDILMFLTHTHPEEPITGGKLATHPVMYRSADGGRTWGDGRHIPEMIGAHEPAVTVIEGVVFVTTHFYRRPSHDPYAGRDYTYCVIYRSEDGGRTFAAFEVTGAVLGGTQESVGQTSRNLIRLADGRILFGVDYGADSYILISDDQGRSWNNSLVEAQEVLFAEGAPSSLMGESVFFFSPSGRPMMLSRLDYTRISFRSPVPCMPEYQRATGLDNFDGEVLFEASDDWRCWTPVRAVGFPALMYPSIVDLGGSRQLFTYTVREIPPAGTGCVYPKVGVQAAIINERPDGFMAFGLDEDVIVIDDSTPASQRNAGCFGNTIRLQDGAMLTPYSFPKLDAEILQLANDKAYLDPAIFNHYAEMQADYTFRYEDFVNEDRELMELNLRRSFSALFLYARCANKGGIGTRVVRWDL
jgi:hypothetical protein